MQRSALLSVNYSEARDNIIKHIFNVIMEVDIVHFMNVNENFGRAFKNDDV